MSQGELICFEGKNLSAYGLWRFSAMFVGNSAGKGTTWSSRLAAGARGLQDIGKAREEEREEQHPFGKQIMLTTNM